MPAKKITDEQIREAAYLMWKEDGAEHGTDQDYWYKAEQMLKAKPARKPAAKKTTAKKPAAKATTTTKKPAATKTATAPKTTAKSTAAKKPAAKKTTTRKTAAKPAPKAE